MSKYLLIGSIESYSGKSGTMLGIVHQLQSRGLSVAYGKPLAGNEGNSEAGDSGSDVEFIAELLGLSDAQVGTPLVALTDGAIQRRLAGEDSTDYTASLARFLEAMEGDIAILEGSGTLWEGSLFGLSTLQISEALAAPVVIVSRYHSPLVVDGLLRAKQNLGDRFLGVVINDIPPLEFETVTAAIGPYLEARDIAVLGMLPSSSLLRSVSVREIARQLKASVLCRPDRLDLMVESLTIGAMNVNSALEYFRRGEHKAVVTGGDRTDLQLAALETSTSCLILTGHMSPQPLIINRAEDLEVPILSVDLDTLRTVEIVDRAFGSVRIKEQIKVDCIRQLMEKYFDTDRLLAKLG